MNRIFLSFFICFIFMTIKINCQNLETNDIEEDSLDESFDENDDMVLSGQIGDSLEVDVTRPDNAIKELPFVCLLCQGDNINNEDCKQTYVHWKVDPLNYDYYYSPQWNLNEHSSISLKSSPTDSYDNNEERNCSFIFNNLTFEDEGFWIIITYFWFQNSQGLINYSTQVNNFTITFD